VVREANNLARLDVMVPAVGNPRVALDDGVRIWEFEDSGGEARFIAGSTTVASSTALTGLAMPLAARQITGSPSASMLVGTSGTAILLWTFASTAFTPVTTPTATFNFTTTALWGSAQSFLGATTATGSVMFYAKGSTVASAIVTSDCSTTANTVAMALPSGYNLLADIAYDDVQSQFVACVYSSTGSTLHFYTTPNPPTTWTLSATATGPSSFTFSAAGGEVAFGICCGVWLVATTAYQYANYVYGTSPQGRVCAFYSLDFGQTWYPANLDMNIPTSALSLRIVSGVDQVMIMTDSDVAMSGRLGYTETL
jgi:hypothetical protein